MADEMQRRWAGSMPEAYDRWLAPAVFRPFAADLARRIADRRPARTLELAAGTGVLTAEILAAAGDGAVELTATDLNEAMVAFGERRAPGAVWRQADALALPFEDGHFGVVACQFGVMFFPDKRAAFAEARRVLEPGGAFLFNTWGPLETHEFAAPLMAGLEQFFPDDPPTFMAVIPHGYNDPESVAADVKAAGFDGVSVETITLEGDASSATDIAVGFCTGTPIRAEIEARGADLGAVTAAVAETMEARLGAGPVTGRMTAHVIAATA
jgi:SAM-dependent methyltransferase